MHWRIISSGSHASFSNMAIDETLFIGRKNNSSPPTLRIYRWKKKTISLGYSQDPLKILNLKNCKKDDILFVRRITGGEAIFHSDELTYSISCRITDLDFPKSVRETYRTLTSFVIEFYKMLGLKAEFSLRKKVPDDVSDFCFRGREYYDIMVNGKKIGGHAQKRTKDIIFQHGVIPIALDENIQDYFNEKLKPIGDFTVSISDLLDKKPDINVLENVLISAFKKTFNITASKESLNEHELKFSRELEEKKYINDKWNYEREHVRICL